MFSNASRTYGNMQLKKLQKEHKKKFTENTFNEIETTHSQLTEVIEKINDYEIRIIENCNLVENEFIPKINLATES